MTKPTPLPSRNLWQEIVSITLLSAPMAVAQLGQIAISTTDLLMYGQLGSHALAAGGLVLSIFLPSFLLGLGIIAAVTPLTARALGAKQLTNASHYFRQGLWAAVFSGVLLCAWLWHTKDILVFFGQSPPLAELAQSYVRATLWGIIPAFGTLVFRNFLAAHEKTIVPMIVILSSVLINAFGNYLLIFGNFGFPRWELFGSGVVTAIVNAFVFVVLFFYVASAKFFREYRLFDRLWQIQKKQLLEILRMGLPIGLAILVDTGFFSATIFLMGTINQETLAAHSIVNQCVAIFFMISLGIAHASTIRCGHAAGRKEYASIRRVAHASILLTLFISFLIFLLFAFFSPEIISWFFPAAKAGIAFQTSVAFMLYGGFFFIFQSLQEVYNGLLRGLKDVYVPFMFHILSHWLVGIPLCWYLGFSLQETGFGGGFGIWLGMIFSSFLLTALMLARFLHSSRF